MYHNRKRIFHARPQSRNYNNPEYTRFRKEVRARDGSRCQFPGCKSRKKLVVHHILRWADAPMLRYQKRNGITLCKTHHDMVTGNEQYYAPIFQKIVRENENNN